MDAVKSFNLELSGLYEVKPPISKAKMTSITKGAIKAIKFYKHVVQSVEKFILKCKPEYKVPGLYVIDSIVRQSRHQFGAERDVFAPRFGKNMQQTFINLFGCPEEEKSKVIRVLNLWQKNHVFPPEVIQPLFDLADPNNPVYKEQNLSQSNGVQNLGALVKGSPALQKSPVKGAQAIHNVDPHTGAANMNTLPDSNTLAQLQQFHKPMHKQTFDGKSDGISVRFDHKLLDYDYDDEDDEDIQQHSNNQSAAHHHHHTASAIDNVGSLLTNPEVLRQLQTLQQSISQTQYQDIDIEKLRKLQEMKQQEEEFDKHLAQTVPNLPFAAECDLKPMMNPPPPSMQPYYMTGIQDLGVPPPGYKAIHPVFEIPITDGRNIDLDVQSRGASKDTPEVEVINLDQTDSRSTSPLEDRYGGRRRRSRSRERSRDRSRKDRRSKRSRSRSHSREKRRPRSRSRDRDRNRDRDRERDKEKDREKERERKKRGLPPFKKEHLCVCSTTLWVGHLSKLVHQEELSDAFGEYGEVISIDLIPPRGCAFIVMHRRQDASRCLEKLKNHKLQGKAITIAWAPGKGLKGKEFKDYWEVDLGVSYIPFSKVKPNIDIELLEDGGMIDEDSMPTWLKTKLAENVLKVAPPSHMALLANMPGVARPPIPSIATIDTSQPPPMPPTALLQAPPTLPLQMVNPFQLNLGMNLPPNMMPNVPIGVPPPNMPPPTTMIPGQLLGFPQGPPPGLLPQPMSLPTPTKPQLHKAMMPQFSLMPLQPVYNDDNMDVEMEDVHKNNKPPPLSDQLLASIGHATDESSLTAAVSRLIAVSGNRVDESDVENHRERRSRDGERRDDQSRYGNERNRDYREGREKREHRRERVNRWGERGNKNSDEKEYPDENERSKIKVHDDSYLLSKQGAVTFEPPTDGSLLDGEIFGSRFNNDNENNRSDDINAFINPEPPSDSFSHQGGDVQNFEGRNNWQQNDSWNTNNENEMCNNNFNDGNEWHSENNNIDGMPAHGFGRDHEWQHNQRGDWGGNKPWEQPNQDQPNFNMGFDRNGVPLNNEHSRNFEDNSHHPPHLSMRDDLFSKGDRFLPNNDFNTNRVPYEMENSEFGHGDNSLLGPGPRNSEYPEDQMHGEFDQGFDEHGNAAMYDDSEELYPQHFNRGGYESPERFGFNGNDRGRPFMGRGGFRGRDNRRGFGGPDRGRGPRSEFWSPKGARERDGFWPRGRGGSFQPRGRGPRHFGPRRNEGDNFQPRFDGPPDHFRNSKFDDRPRRGSDSRGRFRRDRDDSRRQFRRDFDDDRHPREKRSRWGSSPRGEDSVVEENAPNEESSTVDHNITETNDENYDAGNSTPLRDEPQEHEAASSDLPEKPVETEPAAIAETTAVAAEVAEGGE